MINPDDLARELMARVGRADRPDPEVQRTLMDRIRVLPTSTDSPYVIIKTSGTILAEPSLTVEQAVTNYCNVRNARHDLWYRKLHASRGARWGSAGLESRFGDFMRRMFNQVDYDRSYDAMTPDFMFASGKDVVIGDVTVTSTYGIAKQKKYEKYSPLRTILSSTGCQVTQVDFILKDDMSNLLQEIRKFVEKGLIPNNVDFSLEIIYSITATELMVAIKDLCADRHAFNDCLVTKKTTDNRMTYAILEGMLKDEVLNLPFTAYVPTVPEEKLYDLIKEEVERIGGVNYFKKSMGGVDEAFKKVIANNLDKERMPPKSTLKVVDNSHEVTDKVAHDLIRDYINDLASSEESQVKEYILNLLPSWEQLKLMKEIRDKKYSYDYVKNDPTMKVGRVGGEYQYKRRGAGSNPLTQALEVKLKKGKKERNEKKEPRVIDMNSLDMYAEDVSKSISYYGSLSNKPPFLDDSWDAYNGLEFKNTVDEREVYDYCRKTNGAQLCNSLSALYNRITHMGVNMGTFDNVFTPPNGSFICIMPRNHAPVTHRTCDMPFIFITRSPIGQQLRHVEDHHRHSSEKYIYYVSKLSRLNVSKISCWDNAGHRLVASASYIISKCDALKAHKDKVVGLLSYLIVDVHQKISEYLDLLKYISFMPFADLHMLAKLILDKCDLLMKTKMDAWMFRQIRRYIQELSNIEKLNARKPIMRIHNGLVTQDSLGIKMELPSFFCLEARHSDPTEFIEEIGIIFSSRPKHLYGSQFLDASTCMTAQWDLDYDDEIKKHGSWCTVGYDSKIKYPFDSKFAFHADAIHYATKLLEKNVDATEAMIESHLFKGSYGDFLHTNCSLRGCTKERKDRENQGDMHTTSIDACLRLYQDLKFDDNRCKTINVAQDFCISKNLMEFSMSEKDQRGGGRPIATPTLGAKAALMLIEKPEASIGTYTPNNILVAGKSKIKEQHQTYTTAISHGASIGLKNVYQLTEDQTKYSENDNPRKYEIYLRSSSILKTDIRKLQLLALRKLYKRHHLVHRLPTELKTDERLQTKVVSDDWTCGVKASIGWPQGMLNNISTTIHSAADYWILKAFKNAYPNIMIHARGLVHSDDSWVTVCTNSLDDFVLFTVFRMVAKKLFCLKINEKKLWGGKYLGELVSNYNLNGKVHLATSKVLSNGLSNLTYQNWPVDVSTQISTIQQVYRTGATIGTLIMMGTILRQQIISAYQVSGKQKELLYTLPVELGGYPRCSVFKLGVAGIDAMYDELTKKYARDPEAEYTRIVLGAVSMTRRYLECTALEKQNEDKDYAEIVMPSRGELFKGVRYLMPKSKKLTNTLKTIEQVTRLFPSDGLGLIITKPLTLAESLGHLRDTTMSNMYRLAAEKYTQSVRRLAVSQVQQSSGKVVKIGSCPPMTMNRMYEYLLSFKHTGEDLQMTNLALEPDSEVILACSSIVDTAVLGIETTKTTGKVINKMPEYDTIYNTISPLSDVLLYIIDRSKGYDDPNTSLYGRYGTYKTAIGTLKTDSDNIKKRFEKFFKFHTVEKACSLIMQAKINVTKEKSWVQPKIESDTMSGFLKGLYGVSLKKGVRYSVEAIIPTKVTYSKDAALIKSIYTTCVLNEIYDGRFPIYSVENRNVQSVVSEIDHQKLERNETLKLAVLRYKLLDNRDLLDLIYHAEKFSYYWVTPQKYYNGKYHGDWDLKFRMGRLSGRIKRVGGVVRVTVTEANMFLLLKAMRYIAERCFSKGYEYDTGWWLCPIWQQTGQPSERCNFFLKSYSYFETVLTPNYDPVSIGVVVEPSAIYRDRIALRSPDKYVLDNVLRTITAEFMYVPKTEQSFRMGSIFQDLTVPLREDIMLQPVWIDGFENNALFQNKVIEDLTLTRHLSAPSPILMEILDDVKGVDKLPPIWDVIRNIHSKMNQLPILVNEPVKPQLIHEVTWDIAPMGAQDMYEYHETTEVEKLENVAVEYDATVIKGQHKLHYITDIMGAVCSSLWGGLSDDNKLDFICKVINHPGSKEILFEYDANAFEAIAERLGDIMTWVPVESDLHSFIVGSKFYSRQFWELVNRENLTRIMETPSPFHREKELVNKFVQCMRHVFDIDEKMPVANPFKDMK